MLTCWPPAPLARKVSIFRSCIADRHVDVFDLGQDGDGRGGGVDAAGGFGVRHALHAMHAGFEFQFRERAAPADLGDDFLEAADAAGAFGHDFGFPALLGGVALIHAEQDAGEQRGLVAAGAGADFENDVAVIHRILRNEMDADLLLELVAARLQRRPIRLPRSGASRRRSRDRPSWLRDRRFPLRRRDKLFTVSTIGESSANSRDSLTKASPASWPDNSASTSAWRAMRVSSFSFRKHGLTAAGLRRRRILRAACGSRPSPRACRSADAASIRPCRHRDRAAWP